MNNGPYEVDGKVDPYQPKKLALVCLVSVLMFAVSAVVIRISAGHGSDTLRSFGVLLSVLATIILLFSFTLALVAGIRTKKFSIVVTVFLVSFIGLFGLMVYFSQMELVAEFPDSMGRQKQFELRYGNHGDLELRKIGQGPYIPPLLRRDYYGSIKVKSFKWMNHSELKVVMSDNIKIVFMLGEIRIDYRKNDAIEPNSAVQAEKAGAVKAEE